MLEAGAHRALVQLHRMPERLDPVECDWGALCPGGGATVEKTGGGAGPESRADIVAEPSRPLAEKPWRDVVEAAKRDEARPLRQSGAL